MKPIYLALSGGGTRAMVFHCGVLKSLAEHGALEHVSKVSTVSGGSLLVGLLLQLNGMRWPTSDECLQTLLPKLKDVLTQTDLQKAAMLAMLRPANWRFALSRANVLASAIGSAWGVDALLDELPASPVWSINATTAETGKRACIEGGQLRDWTLGSTPMKRFPLRDAMAVSAAFPGLIGPYVLQADSFDWDLPMYASGDEARPAEDRFARIHLYDGGVYDNLGLEPFFDAGFGPKPKVDGVIISSDAGAPLPEGFDMGRLNLFRLKRVADIMSDQTRALRARGLMAYAWKESGRAAYLRLGATAQDIARRSGAACPAGNWLDKDGVKAAAAYPTSLKKVPLQTYELLFRHGYESATIGRAVFGL
ncbi:MAG: patatin-like phospholipase family protein [Polaromonas sp.]|uniref:patatin-like phospholipase family protein n=1 Tax=Polaromonas sp. TaxID=1869339 RepID=UPI00273423C0|nr:patatin-like phospholipase family protein [Polaromonas sp.]MDP3795676.1 patatin-like phospholipase family protein [Polaromonas sp.]